MMRSIVLFVLPAVWLAAAEPVRFREHVIATDIAGGYQVTPLDVNRDGKPDLVALGQGMTELVWFEAPSWERRVLATEMSRMVNLTACGEVIVLAQHFSSEAAKSVGDVVVLERDGDVRKPWRKREIDRIPTSHRLRCADVDGSGKPVVVNGPLTGSKAERPDYRDSVPLVYYRPGEWKRRVIGSENRGVMHGIYVHDWTGDGREDILTASFSGIHVYSFEKERYWKRSEIAKGDPSPWPKSGSSDIAVGHVGGDRFVASIEPWHGNHGSSQPVAAERVRLTSTIRSWTSHRLSWSATPDRCSF